MRRSIANETMVVFLLVMGTAALALPCTGCGGGDAAPNSPPTVGSVRPAAGFQTGGTLLTITGTGFTGATAVTVGGVPAASVAVVDDATITCTTAASATTGTVPIDVTTPNGTGTSPSAFSYVSFPPTPDPLGDVQVDDDAATAPSAAPPVIHCDGSTVYLAWIEDRGVQSHVYFNRSTDGGTTWSPTDTQVSQAPSVPFDGLLMCASGDTIYLSWVDVVGPTQVRMNASTDGGATWLPADAVVSQTPASLTQTFWHTMCCSQDTVTIVWPSGSNYYAQRSSDGGASWLPADVPVTAGGTIIDVCEICCVGSTVHAAWTDTRNGDPDIFYSRSDDGGATWNADLRIDTDGGVASSVAPMICCDGASVTAVWGDARNGLVEVRAVSSGDGGTTWGLADQRVSRFPLGSETAFAYGVCCEGSTVHVTWMDARNGNVEPFYNRSTDGGATYGATDVRLNTGIAVAGSVSMGFVRGLGDPSNCMICCDEGAVHVCWTDLRSGGFQDVFLNSSADGGATWATPDVRLDTDLPVPGTTTAAVPVICCDGPIVYAAWRDDRNNPGSLEGDVFFRRTVP